MPDPRSVECPTCGAVAGSSCMSYGMTCNRKRQPHAARIRAAESAEAERDRREQMTDWRNDSGV